MINRTNSYVPLLKLTTPFRPLLCVLLSLMYYCRVSRGQRSYNDLASRALTRDNTNEHVDIASNEVTAAAPRLY